MGWTYEQKKAWNEANPEKIREYNRRYRMKHAKKLKIRHHNYYLKNKEHIRDLSHNYTILHPEYYAKRISYINKRADACAYFMEYYDHNIILAELDIQCKYRTMIEKKVFE